jgi:hypothetical protein
VIGGGDPPGEAMADHAAPSTNTRSTKRHPVALMLLLAIALARKDKPTAASAPTSSTEPVPAPSVDAAKVAASAIAVVTAVIGIVGGLTGGVARVARNHESALPWAIVLVFAATIIALVPTRSERPSRNLIWGCAVISVIAFGAAAVFVSWRYSDSVATPDRPVVNAKWTQDNGRTILSGTLKASGLKVDDALTVTVWRMVGNAERPPGPRATGTASPSWLDGSRYVWRAGIVYQQFVGADIDGNVNVTFEVPFPTGYDAMQVVASTDNKSDCPNGGPAISGAAGFRGTTCLTLDAPSRAAPTTSSTSSSTPAKTPTPSPSG